MGLSGGNHTARWSSALMWLGVFETAGFAGSNRRHHLLRLRLRTSCASQPHFTGDCAALVRLERMHYLSLHKRAETSRS